MMENQYILMILCLIYPGEKKKRKEITAQAEERNPEVNISYNSGTLVIQGIPYKKRIKPPTPRELIEISPDELEKILKLNY